MIGAENAAEFAGGCLVPSPVYSRERVRERAGGQGDKSASEYCPPGGESLQAFQQHRPPALSLALSRRTGRGNKGLLVALMLLAVVGVAGCATKPDPIPHYSPIDASASLAVIRTRLANVKTVRGEADMTLTDPKGQSVHLDGAYLLAAPSRARLRAWKLGQAVFDLTIREDGAWAYLPREEAKPAAPGLRQSMGRWLGLLGGGDFFVGDAEVNADTLVLTRPEGDGLTLRCTVDRPTLTPRQYELFDKAGKSRFTLTLADYRNAGADQVWPMTITAKSEGGTVEIRTRDVEVNAELPEAAFQPPRRAEKLP